MDSFDEIIPLDFQNGLIKHIKQNNVLIQAKTGSGKTVIGAGIAKLAKGKVLILSKLRSKKHWYYHLIRMGVDPSDIFIPSKPEDFTMGRIHIVHHQMLQNKALFMLMSGKLPVYKTLVYDTEYDINISDIVKLEKEKVNDMFVLWAITNDGNKHIAAKTTDEKKLTLAKKTIIEGMREDHMDYSLCVFDESHKIKTPDALLSHRIKMFSSFKRRVLLTGTSKSLGVQDLWSQLNFVEPEKFPNYYTFISNFSWYNLKTEYGRQRIMEKLFPHYIIVEDHPDLPKFRESLVEVEVNGQVKNWYKKILTNSVGYVSFPNGDMKINHPFAERMRLREVLECPEVFGINEESPLVEWVGEWLEDNDDATVLIATNFKSAARKIAEKYSIPHIDDVKDDADIPNMTRVVGTISSLKESHDFKLIDNIITLPTQYPLDYMQLCGRLTRLSSTNKMKMIYVLFADLGIPSIHDLVWEGLKKNLTESEMIDKYLHMKQEAIARL